MKATISNKTGSPKGFYLGFKQVTVLPGKSIEGDFDDALLQSLKDTGFDVDHKGSLKIGAQVSGKSLSEETKKEAYAIVDAAKAEAEKIVSDAKTQAESILSSAKNQADKMISEAEELTKADK